jgi:hypothetical protein
MTSADAAHRMANLMAGTSLATIPPGCQALKKRLGGQPSSQTHDSTSPAFLILGRHAMFKWFNPPHPDLHLHA